VSDADIANLKYFRVTRGKIAGVPVDISRTGYTGDLGYEIWIPWKDGVKVWDALAEKGGSSICTPPACWLSTLRASRRDCC